jgi:NitT/TauT family transport system permease protein
MSHSKAASADLFDAPPTQARRDYTFAWQVALGVLLLLCWEAAGRMFGATWTSEPSEIAVRLAQWLAGDIYIDVGETVAEVLIGLSLGTVCGVLLGLWLGRSPVLAVVLRPIVVALYSVPLIALSPVFIMFFGLGMLPQVVLVTVVVFFLLFFNTFAGANAVDQDLIASLKLMGSTRGELFRKVIAPASMVWIVGGLKTALPYALVAATTGEMLAGRHGIGHLLSEAGSQFDMPSLYAGLVILMLLGLLVSGIAARLEQWLLRWRHASV